MPAARFGLVDEAVKTSLSTREILGLISRSVKSDTLSPTTRYRGEVSLELCCMSAKLLSRGDGPRHLHASA